MVSLAPPAFAAGPVLTRSATATFGDSPAVIEVQRLALIPGEVGSILVFQSRGLIGSPSAVVWVQVAAVLAGEFAAHAAPEAADAFESSPALVFVTGAPLPVGISPPADSGVALRDDACLRCADGPGGHLSPRELEVLALVAQGQTNKEIANTLFVAPSTIKTHVTSLMTKLNASTRTHLAAIAIRRGLLPE